MYQYDFSALSHQGFCSGTEVADGWSDVVSFLISDERSLCRGTKGARLIAW